MTVNVWKKTLMVGDSGGMVLILILYSAGPLLEYYAEGMHANF